MEMEKLNDLPDQNLNPINRFPCRIGRPCWCCSPVWCWYGHVPNSISLWFDLISLWYRRRCRWNDEAKRGKKMSAKQNSVVQIIRSTRFFSRSIVLILKCQWEPDDLFYRFNSFFFFGFCFAFYQIIVIITCNNSRSIVSFTVCSFHSLRLFAQWVTGFECLRCYFIFRTPALKQYITYFLLFCFFFQLLLLLGPLYSTLCCNKYVTLFLLFFFSFYLRRHHNLYYQFSGIMLWLL